MIYSDLRIEWNGRNEEFLSDAIGTLDISNYAGRITAEDLHKADNDNTSYAFNKVLSSEEWIKIL